MPKTYDVGIYGLWYGNNYGSMITYYALSKVMEQTGRTYAMLRNPLGRDIDLSSLRRSHPLRFGFSHYDITPLYPLSKMKEHNKMFSAFLLGSDQMWNYVLSKPYGQSYFLDFADDCKTKVAYATSFGNDTYNAPDDYKTSARKNLHRFDAVSVRDGFSKRICEQELEVAADLVLDPVFLCEKNEYIKLSEEAELDVKEKYIFAYILDPSPELGKVLENAAKRSGLSVYVIFDENRDKQNCKKLLNAFSDKIKILEDPTLQEWIYLFKNSEFVLTDSFHGSCFSVIFEKPFIVLKNNVRGGERFTHLLGLLGLSDYMVETPSQMTDKFNSLGIDHKIGYSEVCSRIAPVKKSSLEWLDNALSSKTAHKNNSGKCLSTVMTAVDKRMCTGCSACMNACPAEAITLKQDEHGYYRRYVEYLRCINCGLCSAVCPAVNPPENKNSSKPLLFEFVAKDREMLYKSSSGGIFGVLAKEAFRRGGAVSGVAWNDELTAENTVIDSIDDLPKLQKSKYMQSYTGKVFSDVKNRLENGQFVLFEGTPCQAAGLRAFLRKDYTNLLIADILCGNAPSSLFFKKYIEDSFPQGIKSYEFRYKSEKYPWDSNVIKYTDTNGVSAVRKGARQDNYQRVYHSHIMCPVHCEKCSYQNAPRYGDISIGDFWGIRKHQPELDVSGGISAVLCNNSKGKAFLESISQEDIALLKRVPSEWLGKNGIVFYNSVNFASPYRDAFYKAVLKMSFSKAIDYATKPNHGEYPLADSKLLLQCGKNGIHFGFDRSVWEEHIINEHTVLITRPEKPALGLFAGIPLNDCLSAKKSYRFRIKFMIRTDSDRINFHVKDSGSKIYQVIASHRTKNSPMGKWIEKDIVFTPDADFYDEFVIGASQISGADAYIAFEYIYITEI